MVYYEQETEARLKKYFIEKYPYFLLILAGLVIAAFIYFNYLWQQSWVAIEREMTKTEKLEQELKELTKEEKAVVEMSLYKSFSGEYEISHPKDWNVRETEGYATFEPAAEPRGEGKTPAVPGLFFVSVKENPEQFDLQGWLEQTDEPGAGLGSFDRFLSAKEAAELKKLYEADKAFRLDYYEKEISVPGISGLEQYLDAEGGSARIVYLPYGGKIYALTVSSESHFNPSRQDPAVVKFLEIADTMIKSFKMIK